MGYLKFNFGYPILYELFRQKGSNNYWISSLIPQVQKLFLVYKTLYPATWLRLFFLYFCAGYVNTEKILYPFSAAYFGAESLCPE